LAISAWRDTRARSARSVENDIATIPGRSNLAWWQTKNGAWLLGAVVIIANWPYTLFLMMPTNSSHPASAAGDGVQAAWAGWVRRLSGDMEN